VVGGGKGLFWGLFFGGGKTFKTLRALRALVVSEGFVVEPDSEKGGEEETAEGGDQDVAEFFFGEDEGCDEADEGVDDYEGHEGWGFPVLLF
jgi:hypothetical protein